VGHQQRDAIPPPAAGAKKRAGPSGRVLPQLTESDISMARPRTDSEPQGHRFAMLCILEREEFPGAAS